MHFWSYYHVFFTSWVQDVHVPYIFHILPCLSSACLPLPCPVLRRFDHIDCFPEASVSQLQYKGCKVRAWRAEYTAVFPSWF